MGRTFSEMDITVPGNLGYITLLIFIMVALLYPSRNNTISSRKYFYIKQKSCDALLAACTFIMTVSITNNQLYPIATSSSYANSISISKPPTAEEILASLKYRDKKTLTKQEKKILKQEFKKQLKIFTKATLSGNKKDADNSALVVLVIIGAIGLTILLAALVCSISCGGADGLAVAVALLGLTAIIWASVALIRRIHRGPRDKGKNWTKDN